MMSVSTLTGWEWLSFQRSVKSILKKWEKKITASVVSLSWFQSDISFVTAGETNVYLLYDWINSNRRCSFKIPAGYLIHLLFLIGLFGTAVPSFVAKPCYRLPATYKTPCCIWTNTRRCYRAVASVYVSTHTHSDRGPNTQVNIKTSAADRLRLQHFSTQSFADFQLLDEFVYRYWYKAVNPTPKFRSI